MAAGLPSFTRSKATTGQQNRVMSALGAPARGPGASTELLLGDIPFQVVATPTDDFGTPLLVETNGVEK